MLYESKLITKNRDIKDNKKMSSKNKLLSILKAAKPIKRNKTTKVIRKKFLILIKYLETKETFSR